MDKDNEKWKVAAQEFDVVRSKIFNFHNIRSVLIFEAKNKSSQRKDICTFKIDTGSDGNVMLCTQTSNQTKPGPHCNKVVIHPKLEHDYESSPKMNPEMTQ